MATKYLDLENGNDANDGSSFANRKKTLVSLLTVTNAGDDIRVMASADATSLGNAKWHSGFNPPYEYAPYENGATRTNLRWIKNFYARNTTPILIESNGGPHNLQTGDIVRITGHSHTSANGTWRITVIDSTDFTLDGSAGTLTFSTTSGVCIPMFAAVQLETACTLNLAFPKASECNSGLNSFTNWTPTTNVTASLLTTASKVQASSQQLAISATFTTGKVAHIPLDSTVNLSGYQQISFWIRQSAGTLLTANNLKINLCSDSTGNTIVNTFNIPAIPLLSAWNCLTIDLGTAMSSSVASISLTLTTDQAAQTFQFANIIACKAPTAADSLSLKSLIGKNTAGESFYNIRCIINNTVYLDSNPASLATLTTAATETGITYYNGSFNTRETVETYKKEPIGFSPTTSSGTLLSMTKTGSSGSPITLSGGWDRTNMSTQNSITHIAAINGTGYGIGTVSGISFVNVNGGFSLHRLNYGIYASAGQSTITVNDITGCSYGIGGGAGEFKYIYADNILNTQNIAIQGNGGYKVFYDVDNIVGIGGNAITITSGHVLTVNNLMAACPTYAVVSTGYNVTVEKLGITEGFVAFTNASGSTTLNVKNLGTVRYMGYFCLNSTAFSGSCYFSNGTITGLDSVLGRVISTNNSDFYFNDVDIEIAPTNAKYIGTNINENLYRIYQTTRSGGAYTIGSKGIITTETSIRHTDSGYSWKMSHNNTANTVLPLVLNLAQVAVSASNLVTVKAWVRRDNLGAVCKIVIPSGQVGITSDVEASITADVDTWQELTLTFTPTKAGVVKIIAESWDDYLASTNVYIDDVTITQA